MLLQRRMIAQSVESKVDERAKEVHNSGGAQSELLIFIIQKLGSITAYG